MSTHQPIKTWAEHDRPREKLLQLGAQSLSEAELIAILIRTGTKSNTALDVSRMILTKANNNLDELSKLSAHDLAKIKGLGPIKAITIVAAFELARRKQQTIVPDKVVVKSSADAAQFFHALLSDLSHEEFWILLLNRANRVLGKRPISKGGISGTIVDPKIIFREAIEAKASGLILCHNHPSGNLKPSEADIDLTKRIKEAGRNLEIVILDHLIIGGASFYSFADEGIL
jgi:DNA repair protein RadC